MPNYDAPIRIESPLQKEDKEILKPAAIVYFCATSEQVEQIIKFEHGLDKAKNVMEDSHPELEKIFDQAAREQEAQEASILPRHSDCIFAAPDYESAQAWRKASDILLEIKLSEEQADQAYVADAAVYTTAGSRLDWSGDLALDNARKYYRDMTPLTTWITMKENAPSAFPDFELPEVLINLKNIPASQIKIV